MKTNRDRAVELFAKLSIEYTNQHPRVIEEAFDELQKDLRAEVRAYPDEITPELQEILGMMIMQTGPLARCHRDAGEIPDIPPAIEREQAFILHKLIKLALRFGPEWREEFGKELQVLIPRARENIEKREAEKAAKGQ